VQEGLDAASFAVSISRSNETLGADDTLPLLIAAIIETAPPNLHTTLYYVQNFVFSKITTSSLGYQLVNLQAAIQYLRGEDEKTQEEAVTEETTVDADTTSTSPPWQSMSSITDGYKQSNRYSTSYITDYNGRAKGDEILAYLTKGISDTSTFSPHRYTSSTRASVNLTGFDTSNLINSHSYNTNYNKSGFYRPSVSFSSPTNPLSSENLQDWIGAGM
jgi:Vacuolar sorting protein 9 (VPS9) domain